MNKQKIAYAKRIKKLRSYKGIRILYYQIDKYLNSNEYRNLYRKFKPIRNKIRYLKKLLRKHCKKNIRCSGKEL